MARSETIWVVEQYGAKTGNYDVLSAFTVKHEMQSFLRKLSTADLRRCRVKRFKDGAVVNPHYVNVDMKDLI